MVREKPREDGGRGRGQLCSFLKGFGEDATSPPKRKGCLSSEQENCRYNARNAVVSKKNRSPPVGLANADNLHENAEDKHGKRHRTEVQTQHYCRRQNDHLINWRTDRVCNVLWNEFEHGQTMFCGMCDVMASVCVFLGPWNGRCFTMEVWCRKRFSAPAGVRANRWGVLADSVALCGNLRDASGGRFGATHAASRLPGALPARVTTRDRTVPRPRQEYLRQECLAGPKAKCDALRDWTRGLNHASVGRGNQLGPARRVSMLCGTTPALLYSLVHPPDKLSLSHVFARTLPQVRIFLFIVRQTGD